MTFVRQDIWTLGEEDPIITWYRYAVGVLKSREPEDVTGWDYQAAIHGNVAGPAKPLWDQCQHQSWYFLPWHRMYVLRMEEILRAAIEEAEGPAEEWALPYWNYGLGGEFATLPPAFREPEVNGEPNSLFVEQRGEGINGGLEFPATAITAALALARPTFVGAAEFGGGASIPTGFAGVAGRLERTPHNIIHTTVGGWMRNPNTAAQDPIFWLHHANIDRLWHVWRETEGHEDPTEEAWGNQGFDFFDTAGEVVSMTCEEAADTNALEYEYGPEAPPPIPQFEPSTAVAAVFPGGEGVTSPQLIGATAQPITLVGEQVDVEIPIDAEAAGELAPGQRVYLNAENIEGAEDPGTAYGLYVALPPEATPDELDAHLVDNLSFFGIERTGEPGGDEHPHAFRFAVDISGIAHELAARGEWAGAGLRVSLRPLTLQAPTPELQELVPSPAHPEVPITIGRISVVYDA
ncbi:MAG TPA: tyrosinase family protein [Solirubrobacterales bacterium]|nr:tyrosinase family protein [Solirubrobacterales bacterium]